MQDRGIGPDRLASRPANLPPRTARARLLARARRVNARCWPGLISSRLCVGQKQEFFSCLANGDHRDVIVLRCRTSKLAHIPDDFLYNRRRALVRARADRLHHTIEAELVSLRI